MNTIILFTPWTHNINKLFNFLDMKRNIQADFIGLIDTLSENQIEKDTAEAVESTKNVGWMIGKRRGNTEDEEMWTETDGVVLTGNKPSPVSLHINSIKYEMAPPVGGVQTSKVYVLLLLRHHQHFPYFLISRSYLYSSVMFLINSAILLILFNTNLVFKLTVTNIKSFQIDRRKKI